MTSTTTSDGRLVTGVVADPAEIVVDGLAPGGEVVHRVTVVNGAPVDVVVRYDVTTGGDLFADPASVDVGYARVDAAGTTTSLPGDGVDPGACDGLPVVPSGAEVTLDVRVTMSSDAGNDVQGITGWADLTFTATQVTDDCAAAPAGAPLAPSGGPLTPVDGSLATTGADLVVPGLLAVLLLAAGAASRRRRKTAVRPALRPGRTGHPPERAADPGDGGPGPGPGPRPRIEEKT